jgi:hypothetical protein
MEFEIDFADSTRLYYIVKDFNISLFLEKWNAEIIELKFLEYVLFEATSHDQVSAFEECFESPLLEKALDYTYEKIPDKHNLRVFRFIDINENISLEIVCENIHIEKLTNLQ